MLLLRASRTINSLEVQSYSLGLVVFWLATLSLLAEQKLLRLRGSE